MAHTIPSPRVELHVHLDGAIRTSSILEIAMKRGLKLPTNKKEELEKYVKVLDRTNLTDFLATFGVFMPVIAGDEEAIKRIAEEFCEDSAAQGIIYSEVRYSPHLLANNVNKPEFTTPGYLTPEKVIECVNEGLRRGQSKHNIKVRSILCCMRHRPEWSKDVLNMCVKYREAGVVGIDLAGDENLFANPTHKDHVTVFQEARILGVHRTVHAGENGSAENVLEAVEKLLAERIGHGYHVLDNGNIYQQVKALGVHFEICPHSSFATGSVPKKPESHPLIRFARDGANFSISSDDPSVVGKTLVDDYYMAFHHMKLSAEQLILSNFNAAKASFLSDNEKMELIAQLGELYGVHDSVLALHTHQ